jgi:hypothetical protein
VNSLKLLALNTLFVVRLAMLLGAIGGSAYGGWQLRGAYEASPIKSVIQLAGLNK